MQGTYLLQEDINVKVVIPGFQILLNALGDPLIMRCDYLAAIAPVHLRSRTIVPQHEQTNKQRTTTDEPRVPQQAAMSMCAQVVPCIRCRPWDCARR